MKKLAKKWEVRSVHDERRGATISIRLDRERGDFHAEVGPHKIRHNVLDECEKLVRAKLREIYSYTWIKVIVVEMADAAPSFTDCKNNLGVVFKRHAISPRPALSELDKVTASWTHVETRWWEDADGEGDHFDVHFYSGPHESDPEKGVFVLPYSEETWRALELIDEKIEAMRDSLAAFLAGKNLEKRLKLIATQGALPMLLGTGDAS